jgi:FdhD protein
MIPPLRQVTSLRAARGRPVTVVERRCVAEETAVAVVVDGSVHAVMMGTPADLEDFAFGFALTEGAISSAADVEACEIVDRGDLGIEVRLTLARGPGRAHQARRRRLAGPVGCGLCGVESLAEAVRPPPGVPEGGAISAGEIASALALLPEGQTLNRDARALHAAAFWRAGEGLVLVREDVGRHNALDKLAGALVREGCDGSGGVVILTSRVSVEMVQKTARLACPVLVAVSAPTALAVRQAETCGLTLIACARGDGAFEIFAGGRRLSMAEEARAAG